MTKSLSLRRILVLVITSVLLSAFITLTVYSWLSPSIFAQAKFNDLYPRAQYLAEQAARFFASDRDHQYLTLFGLDSEQWGATVYLLDKDRNVVANSDADIPHSSYGVTIENFETLVQEVLGGQELKYTSYLVKQIGSNSGIDLLFIGIPVLVNDEVAGAVIMLKPLQEIVSSMSMLSAALWSSALAVLVGMLPLVYWLANRITYPIRQMRDVALRMAGGDFILRANSNEKGEMGDLASALNHLSSELGMTIGALTYERNQAVAIVNALGEGILSVDVDCRPTQTNPALQTMLVVAGSGRRLALPDEVWEDYRAAISENRAVDRTFRLGSLLIHLTITPITDGLGRVVSAVGVFRDETQAYRLEQTRRDYVANVSHELRTPLTALRALLEPLCDGLINTEDKRQETYDIMLRETLRLSRLVDDMLELSRLQQGSLALEKVRFKLEPLLSELAAAYAAKAAKTGHQITLNLPGTRMPTVLGNPDRVEQVTVSLLNNAFTYTPPGSSITLGADAREDYILVSVEDNGPGISAEDLPSVFDRFYKADKSHGMGAGTGTGLGLAISRELLERLGETITVENAEGGGARFSFTLHYQEPGGG